MKKLLIGILVVLLLCVATVSANPDITILGNKMVNEGATLEFSVPCTAPDSGNTIFTKDLAIGTLTKLNNTAARFSWSPGYDDSGVYNIKFTVNDANSSDFRTISITVSNTNRAPSWTSTIPAQTATEDSDWFIVGDVSGMASDPDATALTFSISTEDTSKVDCSVNSDGTELKIKPAADFYGPASCTIRATDGSLSATTNLAITVTSTPDAPRITSAAATRANLNGLYSYDVQAVDPDGDTLVYSLEISPVGMTIDSSTGLIQWTPNTTGSNSVKVKVTDGSFSVEQSYTLTVDYPLKLSISSIDAWVDGKSDDGMNKNGGIIDKDVRPGSEIKIKVKLKNNFTSQEDIDITDVIVNTLIESIDDDSEDSEKEVSLDDLSPGKSGTADFIFTVSNEAEEGDYSGTITITASDDNRDYDIDIGFTVSVTRKTHDIKISQADLTPEQLGCTRQASLDLQIINIGDEDEEKDDKIKLEAKSLELGIDFSKSEIEMSSDPDDDTNVFEKKITFSAPATLATGSYFVDIKVTRGSTTMDSMEKEVVVGNCVTSTTQTTTQTTTTTQPKTNQTSGGNENVVVNTGTNITGATYQPDTEDETSFSDSGLYIALLVLVIVVVLGVIVVLVVKIITSAGGKGGQYNY